MDNFNLPDFNIDFGNFDPQDISSDETINAVLIVDVSPSVCSYVNELNAAFKDFLEEMCPGKGNSPRATVWKAVKCTVLRNRRSGFTFTCPFA